MIPPRNKPLQCMDDAGQSFICQRSSAFEVMGIEQCRYLEDVDDIHATIWWRLDGQGWKATDAPATWGIMPEPHWAAGEAV